MEAAGSSRTSVTRKGCLSRSISSLGRWYFIKFTLLYHYKFLVSKVKESNYIIHLVPITVVFKQFPHICTEFYTHICWNDSIRHQWMIMVPLAELMAKVLKQMSVELLCFLL